MGKGDSMNLTDEELVGIIKSKALPMECDEMTLLIYRYTRVIKIKASRLKNNGIDAEDLEQEGFIALIDAYKAYVPEKGSFSAFANTCISNRMKTAVAKAKNRPDLAEDYDLGMIEDETAVTDEVVILKDCNKEVYRKLSSLLTEKEFNVLKLYLDGYTYKQISEKLSLPVKSVDNSLSRTRSKLKDRF